MGKYIIELEDKNVWTHGYPDRTLAFDMKIFGTELTPINTGIPLTPYTEPDLEQVRKEAYEEGFDAGRMLNTGKYEKGANDAWEAARTLWNTAKRKEIFGYTVFSTALMILTGQEAIEKIRQYKQEQEEQIQVGDEVENTQTGVRFIVTHMWVNNHGEKGVSGFNRDCSAFSTTIELIRKTGRHFPEIAEVFAKMKETDNG